MRVIIAGSRKFSDYELLKKEVDQFLEEQRPSNVVIVSGTAPGADRLGERYAKEKGFKVDPYPAKWDEYAGKPISEIGVNKEGELYWHRAGMVRNREMAEHADALIAFWDGASRGTKQMIYEAKKKKLIVKVVYF